MLCVCSRFFINCCIRSTNIVMGFIKTTIIEGIGKRYYINKYWLWFYLMVLAWFLTVGEAPLLPLVYKKTTGRFVGTEKESYSFSSKKTERDFYNYTFVVGGEYYFAKEMAADDNNTYSAAQTATVYYNPRNPSDNVIYDFMGMFFPGLGYFFALFVVLSGILLARGFLPKYLKLPYPMP